MKIAFASDHVGYALKLELIEHCKSKGHEIIDVGTHSNERVDYPVYGRKGAETVASGEADAAILACGTGCGIMLAANTVKGVRCSNPSEPYTAKLSKEHNHANAIAIGARVVGVDLAKMIIDAWLEAELFGDRHAERVEILKNMQI